MNPTKIETIGPSDRNQGCRLVLYQYTEGEPWRELDWPLTLLYALICQLIVGQINRFQTTLCALCAATTQLHQ